MKKILSLSLSMIITFSLTAFAAEKRGSLEKSINYVQVKKNGKWQEAESGASLFVGNTLRTGPRSVAEVKYDDGSLTRIGSRSNIVISDRKLNIKRGYIWGKVDKNKTKGLKIFTANAVASIVGTEFFVEYNTDKSTTVTVLEGTIEVQGKSGKVMVSGGTASTIEADGSVSEPTSFDVNKVLERYGEVAKM
ncbi:MAG: FecR domain-containing protein [Candidatus Sericytochromatia bacterium]